MQWSPALAVIRRAYIYGEDVGPDDPLDRHYPSIRELAARHSLGRSIIGRAARRENWVGARRRFHAELQRELHRARARSAIERIRKL
jgi:hypothetical protein